MQPYRCNEKSQVARYFARHAANVRKARRNIVRRDPGQTGASEHLVDYSNPLSVRECEILLLSARGFTSRQISRSLAISTHTVKSHFNNIFNKLGVHNRTMAVAWAVRHGLM